MVLVFGNDYPLTIVMPFILIILGLVFFLITYIRDNIGKLRIRLKKKEKHEKEEIDFNHEFSSLKREIPHMTANDSLDAITLLTKQFLGHKLNIQNEFTFEELPRNKLDWQVIEFTKRLSDLKYSGKEITRDEINHLVNYLSKILKFKEVDYGKKEESRHRIFPRVILPRFPKIIFKFPHRKKPRENIPHKELKPIRINIKLPSRIVINPFAIFKSKKIEVPSLKRESIRKSIIELKKQSASHINKTEKKKVKLKLFKLLKFISKEEDKLSNLESRSLKRFIRNSRKLSRELSRNADEESNRTIGSIRKVLSHAKIEHKILEIPEPVKKEPIKKVHHHKHGLFEKIRISMQSSRILRLIKKAESLSVKHPLISKKLYGEALMMYYRLPIDKEENIAIKLDKFYEKIHGNDERKLIDLKHNDLKATREALKHMQRYRNYVIIENNRINSGLKNSFLEVKKKAAEHMSRTKNREVKSKLSDFLKALSRNERDIFALEEHSIDSIFEKASSLIKLISRIESKEGNDTYLAVKGFFSHLKMDHILPRNDYIGIKAKEPSLQKKDFYEIKSLSSDYPEIKIPDNFDIDELEREEPVDIEKIFDKNIKPIRITPPEIKVVPNKKIIVQPPRYPEKKISERMKKLIEEKESVYKKLREVEGQELDRFKNVRRMAIHEDIGYHDFIRNLKPGKEGHLEEHRIKKILEAK